MTTTFSEAMRARWAAYGNVYSDRLQIPWLQIEATLDYQSGPEALDVWPVIPAELGIGKTTAAKLWCSRLPADKSALVVVRTREQAREFADDVSAWSGEPGRAAALFSPGAELPNALWGSPEKTKSYQVVVVCHKSYEMGLDEFALDAAHARFELVHQYLEGRRSIVIIDEALDQVAEARIGRGAMPALLQIVPKLWAHPRQATRQLNRDHLAAMRVLESVGRALREAPADRERALSASELLAMTTYTVAEATAALDGLWKEIRRSPRIKPDDRAFAIGTIDALRRQLNTAPWTNEDAVSSARLLKTPEGTKGVILDATGQLNNVYRARPDEFDVRHVPAVRDYASVSIYAAKDAGTGKARTARTPELAAKLAAQLVEHYGDRAKDRRVLVVVSADPGTLQSFNGAFAAAGFAEYAVTNWGRVDGRNDWRHYDTLLIGTLHYGTNTQDTNTFLAIMDRAPDDEMLSAVDEVRAIRERRVATDVAQAIGRLRLRTMATADGRCESCDVFIRLPNWDRMVNADRVLELVLRTLPGAAVLEWERASTPRITLPPSARRDAGAALLAYAAQMQPGTADPIGTVRRKLKVALGTWNRVRAAATTPGNPLHDALAVLDARIVPASGRHVSRLVRGARPVDPVATMPGTPTEVAKKLGVSTMTVWRRRQAGRIT
jgi:hypothetical protein